MINSMNSGFRPQHMTPGGERAMVHLDRPDIYGNGGGFGGGFGGAPAPSFAPSFAPSAPPMMGIAPSAPPMMGFMSPFGARNRDRRGNFSLTGFNEAQQDIPVNFMAQQFGGGGGGSFAMQPFGRYSGYSPFFGGFNPYGQMF